MLNSARLNNGGLGGKYRLNEAYPLLSGWSVKPLSTRRPSLVYTGWKEQLFATKSNDKDCDSNHKNALDATSEAIVAQQWIFR
jgi:hypothetical protein